MTGRRRGGAASGRGAPRSIDGVIERLDRIVASAHAHGERQGYFAALYRNVTTSVRDGIQSGRFEDAERMERLDVAFANRYLGAVDAFIRGHAVPRSWSVACEAAETRSPLILQHLLLGINAHINFDLGPAAAEIAPGEALPALKHDFDAINRVLARLIAKVKQDLDEVSPWLKLLDSVDSTGENAMIGFAVDNARANAWSQAKRLAALPRNEWSPDLDVFDRTAAVLGHLILHPPGFVLNVALSVIRARESNDVPRVIDVLSGA